LANETAKVTAWREDLEDAFWAVLMSREFQFKH
jgi:hypothetical protein